MVENQNWVRFETHIGWEEVPVTRVYGGTILERLLEDWLEETVSKLITEAENNED